MTWKWLGTLYEALHELQTIKINLLIIVNYDEIIYISDQIHAKMSQKLYNE